MNRLLRYYYKLETKFWTVAVLKKQEKKALTLYVNLMHFFM